MKLGRPAGPPAEESTNTEERKMIKSEKIKAGLASLVLAASVAGLGVATAAPASAATPTGTYQSSIQPIGQFLPRVGYGCFPRGTTMFGAELYRGYSPARAAYLAQRIKNRIYPASSWNIYTPLRAHRCHFYYR
jgi:hypothetical protein